MPSRLNNRATKTKTDKILNTLIGVVLVLIIITAGIIFWSSRGGDEERAASNRDNEEAVSEDTVQEDEEDLEDAVEENDEPDITTEPVEPEESDDETPVNENSDDTSEETKTPPANGEFEPIGTSQTGEHVSSYDKNSVDWKEKVSALSYATGLAPNDMIVWYIGNGGSPQKSVGTVSSNDKEKKYKVYLEWVDQEGWLPTKVETLQTLDGSY
ncbi:YrrS family protein [Paenisporosarcina cavernae]|uniref:DUF1510 family protein n=1 Tax=Paenisporosarcina cavernae TaxID=2320858 RepID=A0A385YSD0_9BACL|nr:YrrS family protein [Paenisporosarcina cavernae]AYC29699.1 DUF1510 family protein [Paenisporosarcina cavernae]